MILNSVVEWAESEASIKAIIQLGSQVTGKPDAYSDYDLALFCTTFDAYTRDEKWLSQFGKVWVIVHEISKWGEKAYPVLLSIFEGGEKLDLTFYDLEVLRDIIRGSPLSGEYKRGYKVLVDKGSWTPLLPLPGTQPTPAQKPSRQEFDRVIKEFWFEVHHVVKYLIREDLWSVKFRVGLINDHFLIKMIEWNEEAKRNWEEAMPPLGKRMQAWVSPATWDALHTLFAHFESKESWEGLRHTIALFRTLATDTAQRLGYTYLFELDKNMTEFISTSQKIV